MTDCCESCKSSIDSCIYDLPICSNCFNVKYLRDLKRVIKELFTQKYLALKEYITNDVNKLQIYSTESINMDALNYQQIMRLLHKNSDIKTLTKKPVHIQPSVEENEHSGHIEQDK